jgi:glycogen debranching enzyme
MQQEAALFVMKTPMLDFIEVENQHYVRAKSSLSDPSTNVLMAGDTFAVFDRRGDFRTKASTEQGLFYNESRHLSKRVLRLAQDYFLLLSSNVRADNALLSVDLTNPEMVVSQQRTLRHSVLHLCRSIFVWANCCYEQIEIRNYTTEDLQFDLILEFEADFADIFEVRGHAREKRGQFLEPSIEQSSVTLAYKGLDGLLRKTQIESSRRPAVITRDLMRFRIEMEPLAQISFTLNVFCRSGEENAALSIEEAEERLVSRNAELSQVEIYTANEQFNDWINRSIADLKMLVAPTPKGLYPYAGVPWFSTIFGRDGIVTALECLWFCPAIAKGVLSCLASLQTSAMEPDRDAEPGKILHEARQSEMARVGEVPFRRYYGSIDATPLFVLLAAAYFKRTGDRDLIQSIWPHVESALNWIDLYGDRDGDGFVEYGRSSAHGLLQQGWKDSSDSIFHADGSVANGPIALCEVQGYIYGAKSQIADVAEATGQNQQAEKLRHESKLLKQRFQDAFWCPEIRSYALALDGQKKQCRVRSSNAGHTLFTGIASEEHAVEIIREFRSDKYFSGWGVRTIATTEVHYNPMSYHNGSIWPHDNALIAYGLAQSTDKMLAAEILTGLFDASIFLKLHRLPELFCGFPKQAGRAPTLYPVACAPQAWAAGAIFLLLQACLGMEVQATNRIIRFVRPVLPESIPYVRIRHLSVDNTEVDLEVTRYQQTVSISIARRVGDVRIISIK